MIGEHLKRLRKEQKLTMEALAKRSGTDRSDIGRLENGKYRVLVDTLWRILEPLGVKLSDFIAAVEEDLVEARKQQPLRTNASLAQWSPPKPPKVANNPYSG